MRCERTDLSRPPTRPRRLAAAITVVGLVAGCGRATPPVERQGPRALALAVLADTGRTTTLHVQPPSRGGPAAGGTASAWLTRVSPARLEPAALPSPEAVPDTVAWTPPPPPALVIDGDLKPPLLRSEAPLAVPSGARGSVDLEVRIDERGEVSDVRWAGGTRDRAMVDAASACARAMRFFPAERAAVPVPVWCRQRFDFGPSDR